MKKKFETSDIEQYFQITNNIAPIYNEEKVHHIINSPKAVARLKGKYNNLLKITIMTTIFAVIISAVLLWPGVDSSSKNSDSRLEVSGYETDDSNFDTEVLDSRFQVSDSGTEVSGSSFQFEPIEQALESNENDLTMDESSANVNNDEMVASAELSFVSSETMASSVDDVGIEQDDITKALSYEDEPQDLDINNFQTIDGSRFYVEANKEILIELGFQFTDSSIYYQNLNLNKKKISYLLHNEKQGDCILVRTSKLSNSGFIKNVPFVQYPFYPVIETYRSGSIVSTGISNSFDFELANDTLFPVIIRPELLLNFGLNDVVLWFTVCDELFTILGKEDLIPVFNKIKKMKNDNPFINYIDYSKPFFNDIYMMDLSMKELNNMGFEIINEELQYTNNDGANVFWINARSWVTGSNNSTALMFVTNKKGDLYFKGKNIDSLQINKLVPIVLHSDSLEGILSEDIVCWFEPSIPFFDTLPERISTELRKEYNYIIAEDKSALEKPECKYFDECKSTLEITDFKAFPNPATYEVSVSFELPETIEARISLVDLTGREKQVLHPQSQFAAGRHQLNFDLSSVAEGMYLLTLYSDKGVQTQRLMVVR